jgi:chromosome segregation ATPase
MIEPAMYLGIGFLVATLLALAMMPLVHNRAVRLTTRRLEAATPLSLTEIHAEKDQLRAEFAISIRKLETQLEQLKTKSAMQAAEIGKKTDAISRMKLELDEKSSAQFAAEEREKLATDKLRLAEDDLGRTRSALETTEAALLEARSQVSSMSEDVAVLPALKAAHDARVNALAAQVTSLTARAEAAERELDAARAGVAAHQEAAEAAIRGHADVKMRNDVLASRVSELDRQVASHRAEAETARRQIEDFQAQLAGRTAEIAAREGEVANLRHALDEARTMLTTMRNELAAKAGRALTVERLRNEKAEAEQALREAQEQRAEALRELATIRTQAESSWEVDRMENALLRERIDDIAGEVARLALMLEGPQGPIASLLATSPPDTPGGRQSLASRISAIRTHLHPPAQA